jgi:hypothetical protein
MPRRNGISLQVLLLPLGLLVLVAAAFGRRKGDEWDWEVEEPEPEEELPPAAVVRSRRPASRIAVAAMFTTLFFAGAAFTAGAGDQMVKILDGEADAALAELYGAAGEPTATEPVVEPAATDAAAAAEPEMAPASEQAAEAPAELAAPPAAEEAADAAPDPADEIAALAPVAPTVATTPAASARTATTPAKTVSRAAPPPVKPRPTKKWIVKRATTAPASAPEIEREEHGYGEPTVWLNRALPDPTPPSARLTRAFAHRLVSAAERHDADWAAVLGVLRAQGERGPAPAIAPELDSLASRLGGGQAWRGALALSGRTGFADRAEALADLYRSIGIETLITGYEASKDRLAKRLLDNENVLIYAGGREDIAAGRIDVRVVVLLSYLAERHGSIAVSSLFSGHRTFARPGVVSAHMYGHAVDVAAVGGTSIAGHQQPGGLTEAAVRSVLLLPSELQPQQVISLLGLGGPSFPMRDHGDHIHIGF